MIAEEYNMKHSLGELILRGTLHIWLGSLDSHMQLNEFGYCAAGSGTCITSTDPSAAHVARKILKRTV